jgi:hypothetical protein
VIAEGWHADSPLKVPDWQCGEAMSLVLHGAEMRTEKTERIFMPHSFLLFPYGKVIGSLRATTYWLEFQFFLSGKIQKFLHECIARIELHGCNSFAE